MKKYDYLIVGSGIYGSTFARLATDAGRRCLVVDRRHHIAGNIYTEKISGINVHIYGAHILHTSNSRVWRFLNRFAEFNRYTNSPIANYHGKLYNMPFNMNTFREMWGVATPAEAQARIDEEKEEVKRRMLSEGVSEPRNLEQQALLLVGSDIYERLVKGYTEKQWGRPCNELPAFIIRRLPVRLVFDNNYFNDRYQGIPIGGYTKMIDRMLDGIEVITDYEFLTTDDGGLPDIGGRSFKKIVYTGQIDQFFHFSLGRLEYRSLRFEHETLKEANHQGNAVMNFTAADVPYTRIVEHKHFESFGDDVYTNPTTVITREYPATWSPGREPFYTVNDERNNRLAKGYKDLAAKQRNVIFGGRLAEYRYIDMDDACEKAILDWEEENARTTA